MYRFHMSERFETHRDIINVWPTLAAFAEDLGIPYETAKGMRARGSIDGRYWADVVTAAGNRGFAAVTLEALAEVAAAKRPNRAEAG